MLFAPVIFPPVPEPIVILPDTEMLFASESVIDFATVFVVTTILLLGLIVRVSVVELAKINELFALIVANVC